MLKTISVMGLGKLGAPLAPCFVAWGFRFNAIDVDRKKVGSVNQGAARVSEPGLAELMQACEGRLTATQDAEGAIRDSEATFIVVSTPSEPNGGFSLRYVLPCVEAIGKTLRTKSGFHLVAPTSPVMPGPTAGDVRQALQRASRKARA